MTAAQNTADAGRAKKLTISQHRDLLKLSDPKNYIRNRGITNATLSALERRGLAVIKRVPSEYLPGHMDYCWFITDAGRAALAAAKTGGQP